MLIILSFCTIVFAADNNEETNASLWIQSMRFMRKSLVESNKIQDLERADKEILLKMREKDFSDVLNEVSITSEKDIESIVIEICNSVLNG